MRVNNKKNFFVWLNCLDSPPTDNFCCLCCVNCKKINYKKEELQRHFLPTFKFAIKYLWSDENVVLSPQCCYNFADFIPCSSLQMLFLLLLLFPLERFRLSASIRGWLISLAWRIELQLCFQFILNNYSFAARASFRPNKAPGLFRSTKSSV